jgi:hypothetical protein
MQTGVRAEVSKQTNGTSGVTFTIDRSSIPAGQKRLHHDLQPRNERTVDRDRLEGPDTALSTGSTLTTGRRTWSEQIPNPPRYRLRSRAKQKR